MKVSRRLAKQWLRIDEHAFNYLLAAHLFNATDVIKITVGPDGVIRNLNKTLVELARDTAALSLEELNFLKKFVYHKGEGRL